VTDKVVDASALAAAAFLEKEAAVIGARLAGHKLFAPFLLDFEISNICRKKMRDHPADRSIIFAQFVASRSVPVELRDIDFPEVVELATLRNITAYDASYLWLARRLGAELVTLDKRLEKAAKATLS